MFPDANMYSSRAPRGPLLRLAVFAAAALLAAAQVGPMKPALKTYAWVCLSARN